MKTGIQIRKLITTVIAIISQATFAQVLLAQNAAFNDLSNGYTRHELTTKSMAQPPLFPSIKVEEQIQKSSTWRGGRNGFLVGAGLGTLMGLSGHEWVLDNGKVVPAWQHATVDALLVAIPMSVIGGIIGSREPRTTLSPSKLHVALGGGWSSLNIYSKMLEAFESSGFVGSIPRWFGHLHYPNGKNVGVPYTWNFTMDYNIIENISVGFSYNVFIKQQVEGIDNETIYGKGSSYSLMGDYIFNPINPLTKYRLQFAIGAGLAYRDQTVAGALDLTDSEFEISKSKLTPHLRATLDWYASSNLSLQLKIAEKFNSTINIPEQNFGGKTLKTETLNFRSVEITLGVRYHFEL